MYFRIRFFHFVKKNDRFSFQSRRLGIKGGVGRRNGSCGVLTASLVMGTLRCLNGLGVAWTLSEAELGGNLYAPPGA